MICCFLLTKFLSPWKKPDQWSPWPSVRHISGAILFCRPWPQWDNHSHGIIQVITMSDPDDLSCCIICFCLGSSWRWLRTRTMTTLWTWPTWRPSSRTLTMMETAMSNSTSFWWTKYWCFFFWENFWGRYSWTKRKVFWTIERILDHLIFLQTVNLSKGLAPFWFFTRMLPSP